jgi:molybdenum-dependent DNA-binding transcriptional regulator ModE
MTKTEKNKTKVIKHLRRHGNIVQACKHAEISHRLYYYWLKDQEFRSEARGAKIDFLRKQG